MGRSIVLSLAPKLLGLGWKRYQIRGQKTGKILIYWLKKIENDRNCYALANMGTFVTSMLRLLGLTFSLSTLCGLYVVIVWNLIRMQCPLLP